MKTTIISFIGIFSVSLMLLSCQKELSPEDPQQPLLDTDTSVIFAKKTIFHYVADSSIQLYKNNKLSGVKGYIIVDSSLTQNYTSTTSRFRYNNLGHLTEIQTEENASPNKILGTFKLTREGNKIKNIKWDELGIYGMDRNYDYESLNDTLLIRYNFNVGRDLYLDSSSVTMFTNLELNRLYRIFKEGEFDFTNVFSNSKGVHYNEREFRYDGKDMISVKYYGETFYTTTPYAYSHEADSAVCYFSRDRQVNSFLSDVETAILGKEFRILCYDQTDSVSWVLNNYFNWGNWFSFGSLTSPRDAFQYENVFNASVNPLTHSTIDYAVKRDGVIADQNQGFLYKKLVYSLDELKRIKNIKEYDASTNQLVVENYFYYP